MTRDEKASILAGLKKRYLFPLFKEDERKLREELPEKVYLIVEYDKTEKIETTASYPIIWKNEGMGDDGSFFVVLPKREVNILEEPYDEYPYWNFSAAVEKLAAVEGVDLQETTILWTHITGGDIIDGTGKIVLCRDDEVYNNDSDSEIFSPGYVGDFS